MTMSTRTILLQKAVHLGIIIILGLGIIYLYYPLNNFIRHLSGDQWFYFLDTMKYDNAWDLIQKFYSYNRVRQIYPGDSLLFRPIMFSLIGVEKALWGADFFKWQAVASLLHLINALLFIRLLCTYQQSWLAYLFGAFFAYSSSMFGAVEKINISAYLLCVTFIVITLTHLQRYINRDKPFDIWITFVFATLACFAHELGAFVCLICAFYLFSHHRNRPALLLLLPMIAYAVVNAIDYQYHFSQGHFEVAVNNFENVRIVHNMLALKLSLVNVLVLNKYFFINLFHLSDAKNHILPGYCCSGLFIGLNVLLFVFLGMHILHRSIRKHSPTPATILRKPLILPLMILLVYSYLIAVGRLNTRGGEQIEQHYGYMFNFMFLLFGYLLLDIRLLNRYPVYLKALVLLIASGVVLCNYCVVWQLRPYEPRGFFDQLQTVISSSRQQPGFSFALDEQTTHRYTNGAPIAMVLFHQYYKEVPKYVISVSNNSLVVEENLNNRHFPVLVDFTGMSPRFNIYHGYLVYRIYGRYYGAEYGNHAELFPLQAESLEEAKGQLYNRLLSAAPRLKQK